MEAGREPRVRGEVAVYYRFAELKKRQREMWGSFVLTAMFTTPVAGRLRGALTLRL